MSGADYTYEIKCDLCDALLGWWCYAGPFHGSMCCDSCHDRPPSTDEDYP